MEGVTGELAAVRASVAQVTLAHIGLCTHTMAMTAGQGRTVCYFTGAARESSQTPEQQTE